MVDRKAKFLIALLLDDNPSIISFKVGIILSIPVFIVWYTPFYLLPKIPTFFHFLYIFILNIVFVMVSNNLYKILHVYVGLLKLNFYKLLIYLLLCLNVLLFVPILDRYFLKEGHYEYIFVSLNFIIILLFLNIPLIYGILKEINLSEKDDYTKLPCGIFGGRFFEGRFNELRNIFIVYLILLSMSLIIQISYRIGGIFSYVMGLLLSLWIIILTILILEFGSFHVRKLLQIIIKITTKSIQKDQVQENSN